jgi:hypothetical protein
MLNPATAFTIAFLTLTGLLSSYLGWVSSTNLLDVGMGLVALIGSLLVLKLPWDLYFEARHVQVEQEESRKRDIEVDPEDLAYASKIARRLLFLALVTHLLAAGLAAGISWLSGGQVGYYFSGFFLISTCFRPLGSFYKHMMRRLRDLRRKVKYPREDVQELRDRVFALEHQLQREVEQREEQGAVLRALASRSDQGREQLAASLRQQDRTFTTKVEQVCHEFERSIEKLTEDQTLLEGMRAFVRMVKSA